MEVNPYVPDVHFEQIPIKNLVSSQDYQRHLSRDHIQKAAKHFNLCQINPVKVSRRHGINYVFNGQHTIEIVALVSGSRDTPVWCMVYDELEYEEEADIFANQQRYVKKLLPYEIFMANIEAGNDDQLIIKALVESFDLRIGGKNRPGCICCVATLEDIYHKYGYEILERSLRLCVATWEGDVDDKQYDPGRITFDCRLRGSAERGYVCRKSRPFFTQGDQPHSQRTKGRFRGVCRSYADALQ